MLFQVQKYDIKLRYKSGKQLIIADTLSRAYMEGQIKENFDNEIQAQVCLVKSQLNVTKEKLQEIINKTQKDKVLVDLKDIIINGWLKNHKELKNIVKPYTKYKEELTTSGGLIFIGCSLVIPEKLRKEILNKIHYNHLGINKCLSLAKESVFWLTMSNEIRQMIESCYVCLKYSKSQTAKESKPHEIKVLSWNKVGCNLFELQGKKYLLIIDYYSKYVEIKKIEKTLQVTQS